MTRPKVRVIEACGRTYYGTDALHLHDSIAQAADAARRESVGWLGPRSGIRGTPSGDAQSPMQVWTPEMPWRP